MAIAYYLKDDLRQIWEQPDQATARRVLRDWIARAGASGIPMLQKFALTLAKHRVGILAWYAYPISTGPLEGTNTKIQAMKRQAYGFRDRAFYKLKILGIHETRYALVGLAKVTTVNVSRKIGSVSYPPALRDRAEGRVLERIWEEAGGGGGHADGLTAGGFGGHWVEVHEPRLEQRPRHPLQRLVHPPVQLDLVVQRAENAGDSFLLPTTREWEQLPAKNIAREPWLLTGLEMVKTNVFCDIVRTSVGPLRLALFVHNMLCQSPRKGLRTTSRRDAPVLFGRDDSRTLRKRSVVPATLAVRAVHRNLAGAPLSFHQ